MAPNYTRLDSIQSRAINVAKRTTFRIRRNALRSIERNAVFTFGVESSELQATLNAAVINAYLAGFETTVPETGLSAVQRRYGINTGDILSRYGTEEMSNYIINVSDTLEQTITELQFSAQSRTEKRQVLRKEFENLGLTGNPYRIEAIVNTATAAAFNAGRIAGFNLPQNSERIWGYRYQTQEDDRVRANHAAMHGFIREKNDLAWTVYRPPNGYNCRCWLEPVIIETEESDLPRMEDGTVALPDAGFNNAG